MLEFQTNGNGSERRRCGTVSFASWPGVEHTPDNERLVLLAFLSLSPLERGGFLHLFNSVTNVSERRRCDMSIAPGVSPGLDGDIVI